MAGEAVGGGLIRNTALDPTLTPGPWAVPAGIPLWLQAAGGYRRGPPRERPAHSGNEGRIGVLVARLGLLSGWQLRSLLRCAAADLPARLIRAGVLSAYVLKGPVSLPPLYGPGPDAACSLPPWEGPAAIKQVAANQFLVRLLDLGPAQGAAFCAEWGPGLSVVRNGERFTVAAFREGREDERRFLAFLGLYRPGDGKTVVVAAGVRHLVRLSLLARHSDCPLRLTWDGALFHLPLAQAFCRVGDDGPEPVLMSALGDELRMRSRNGDQTDN